MRSSILGLLLCLGVGACATPPPARLDRVLAQAGGLVISNSPMFVGTALPDQQGGVRGVTYSILLQNVGAERYEFPLRQATFVLKGRPGKADCRVGSVGFEPLRVHPGDRYRIDCRLRLDGELAEVLSRGDADGILGLPVRVRGVAAVLRFQYRFRVEDVS